MPFPVDFACGPSLSAARDTRCRDVEISLYHQDAEMYRANVSSVVYFVFISSASWVVYKAVHSHHLAKQNRMVLARFYDVESRQEWQI